MKLIPPEDVIINGRNKKKKKQIEGSKYKKRTKLKGDDKVKSEEYSIFRKGLSELDENGLTEKEINRMLEMTDNELLSMKKAKELEWSVYGIKLDPVYQKLLKEYTEKSNRDVRNIKIQREKLAELLTKFKKKERE